MPWVPGTQLKSSLNLTLPHKYSKVATLLFKYHKSLAFQSKGSFARNTPSPSVRQTSTPPITWREAEVKLERTDVSCDDSEVDMVHMSSDT